MHEVLRKHGTLSDGQVVTLLIGLGTCLEQIHQRGEVFGPIHPAHVCVGGDGRPELLPVSPPPGWTSHDDWVGLVRLGRSMGAGHRARALRWEAFDGLEGAPLLRRLMTWATPEPLPMRWVDGQEVRSA
ncbi:MAG TPA: hypothetical protein VFX15_07840 [Actinomycetes bacterium]|nr:hypothetical protein [Actinomycetes bacterium]